MTESKDEFALILKELEEIRRDLAYIKEHMVEVDSLLTDEEALVLKEAEGEFREGKTKKLEDLKRELGEL
nr:hypothetical protein [Candidatus Freyarchaeota archaeon]